MQIIRERDSFKEPSNALGLCECGEEIELPLEAHIYYSCPGCGKCYDCDGILEVEEQ